MKSKTVFLNLEEYSEGYKLNASGEFYLAICPECIEEKGPDYKKHKMYISSDYSWGYCHRCKTLFKNPRIVFNSPHLTINEFNPPVDSEIKVYTSMKNYVMADPQMDKRAETYLLERNPDLISLWDTYNMRCDEKGIYIPYPSFNYYIRANYDRSLIKYYLPPTPEKPCFIIDRKSTSWIVCEGVFDALALSLMNDTDNLMAVTGSTMTRPQLNHFRSYIPREVLIFLDETRLSTDLKLDISKYLTSATVDVIPSDGEDPEEYYINHYKVESRSN